MARNRISDLSKLKLILMATLTAKICLLLNCEHFFGGSKFEYGFEKEKNFQHAERFLVWHSSEDRTSVEGPGEQDGYDIDHFFTKQ